MMSRGVFTVFLAFRCLATVAAADESAIETLKSINGPTGADAARKAVAKIIAGGTDNLFPLLEGFTGATPLGANWLRSGFETLATAESQEGRLLPANDLANFILNTQNAPTARRLAYEWLLKQDPEVQQTLIPGLLEDSHPDFRRDAVAMLIDQAKESDEAAAHQLYRQALKGAVHDDQVKTIAAALKAAGEPVDIQKHFGFLADWQIVGPFDNREKKGYAVAYPPELFQDLNTTYDGQLGKVNWQEFTTDDDYGIINIGDQIENYKGSLMYAVTTFRAGNAREAEFRLGTPNAWKLWVNGELVFEREEYHRSTRMDQHRIPALLVAGDNTILVKVCQNEQEEAWAQDYKFQLRVSDSSGAAILPAGENNE
jgi:hypothetical protein